MCIVITFNKFNFITPKQIYVKKNWVMSIEDKLCRFVLIGKYASGIMRAGGSQGVFLEQWTR